MFINYIRHHWLVFLFSTFRVRARQALSYSLSYFRKSHDMSAMLYHVSRPRGWCNTMWHVCHWCFRYQCCAIWNLERKHTEPGGCVSRWKCLVDCRKGKALQVSAPRNAFFHGRLCIDHIFILHTHQCSYGNVIMGVLVNMSIYVHIFCCVYIFVDLYIFINMKIQTYGMYDCATLLGYCWYQIALYRLDLFITNDDDEAEGNDNYNDNNSDDNDIDTQRYNSWFKINSLDSELSYGNGAMHERITCATPVWPHGTNGQLSHQFWQKWDQICF